MQQTVTLFPYWMQILVALVPTLAAIFAGIGLFLNTKQSRRSNAQARAAIVNNCLGKFTEDRDMQEIYSSIEYSQFAYDPSAFHNSPQEAQLDKLLMLFSTVALSWRTGLLNRHDLQPLQYFVRRIARDHDVIRYIEFVIEFSSRAGLGHHPYVSFLEMAGEIEHDA